VGILLEKTDRLNTSIENLRSQRAGQLAGPQSFGLAKLVGTGQDSVRIDFRVPLALVIGSVRCFGLLALSLWCSCEAVRRLLAHADLMGLCPVAGWDGR
jgi:hypothetical protein